MGLEIEKIKRKLPESYNLNLSSKRSKTGDVSFNLPHMNIGNMLRTGNVKGPQTQSTAASL